MNGARGQALAELAIFISLAGVLVLLAIPQLMKTLDHNYTAQQALVMAAGQRDLQQQLELEPWSHEDLAERFNWHIPERAQYELRDSADYSYGRNIEPVLGRLMTGSGSLPFRNLHTAELVWPGAADESDEPQAQAGEPGDEEVREPGPTWYRYSRLSDEWRAATPEQLVRRPQVLTSSEYLRRLGIEDIQSVLQWLPFGRSLRPDSLKFGYVNTEVVPRDRLCRTEECDD